MDLAERFWNGLIINLDLLIAAGALYLVLHLARRWASTRDTRLAELEGLDTWVIIAAVIGARAGAAVAEAHLYLGHPLDLVRINQGLSLYGALGAGAVGVAFFAWRHHKPLLLLVDALALFLPLGIAVYRTGCLAYGFCGGKAAAFPLGVPLPGHVGTRYPSELLEGVLALGLFFILLKLAQRLPQAGVVAGTFLLIYPLSRAVVDFTRFSTGPWPWADPLISLGVALLGLAMLFALRFTWRTRAPNSAKEAVAAKPRAEE